jgi:hypothetical protein
MLKYAKSSPEVEAKDKAKAYANREKQQVMDTVIEKYIAAARFATLTELDEVTQAVERLHHAYAEDIAAKHELMLRLCGAVIPGCVAKAVCRVST